MTNLNRENFYHGIGEWIKTADKQNNSQIVDYCKIGRALHVLFTM